MKKAVILLVVVFIICASFISCADVVEKLPMPDKTELEFWVTENVESVDFSAHDEISGWFGAREFLGAEYRALHDSNGNNIHPSQYVSYLVTAYPDYADGGEYVTRITVADPTVTVYGLTVKSSVEDFKSILPEYGYSFDEDVSSTTFIRFLSEDGVTITFSPALNEIAVSVEVSNRDGIIF